jgi:hypothetical protein
LAGIWAKRSRETKEDAMELQDVYNQLLPRLQTSANLEKQASDDALVKKAGTDLATLHLIKTAAGRLAKGLLTGAGIAIPTGLVGAGLIHQAGNESRKTVEDVRNKALQTALGIAALGGGLYALHRTLKPDTKTTTSYRQDQYGQMAPSGMVQTKVSAAHGIIEKLATAGFLDVLFQDQRENAEDSETRTKAAECQLLNAEHSADLLRQLLD